MKKYISIVKTVFILVPFLVLGQVSESKQSIYTLFDNIVGLDNTGIYNGVEYRKEFRTLDYNHPYFVSPNFIISTIEYDDQVYYNINLKYNLYDQEIIAKLKSKNSSETVIKLYKNRVSSFTIKERSFINVNTNSNDVKGFYEVAFKDADFLLLIKHQKFKKDLYQNEQMYVEYITAKKEYLILSNNRYNKLNSKKDIANLFPDLKQEINQFYRSSKSLRKTNYDQFLINLLQELKRARLK